MKKLLYPVATFSVGAIFGLALAAVTVLTLISFDGPLPISSTGANGTPDVTVTVSEQHLNALVAKQMGGSGGYRNLHVKVDPGNTVFLTGETDVGGFTVPVQVKGSLFATASGLGVKVVETRVGVLPVNVDVSGIIDAPLAEANKAVLPLNHYRVSGVSTQTGSVMIDLVGK